MKMEQIKHRFIFEYAGGKVEAYKTQKDIAEMLQNPAIKLISINDTSNYCYRKKGRAKRK